MSPKALFLIAVAALGAAGAWPVYAEVPTAEDFAACNKKAADEVARDTTSASPRMDKAVPGAKLPPSVSKDATGNMLSSDKDPQINGMAADRANDRAYIAAYRSCMRQRGF